ncbi:MAG: 50S ribosomal protein L32 [Candidatus Campbellbacteria bacterium]|nr:50S ribosomal protein L32 [Candidatus Campbellbacteria bacterium]
MSIRMRHTKGHTGNRRAHHGLKEPRLTRDTETNSYHLRHRVDMKTGMYRGRKVFETVDASPAEENKESSTEGEKDTKKSS